MYRTCILKHIGLGFAQAYANATQVDTNSPEQVGACPETVFLELISYI